MTSRRDPFEELERVFDRMGGFDDLDGLGGREIPVDVAETDDAVTVTADLPGYEKGDIDVTIRDGRLTLRAERDSERGIEANRYHRRERTHEEVSRTVTLPADVEKEAAGASYSNGVLTVELPKRTAGDAGHDIEIE